MFRVLPNTNATKLLFPTFSILPSRFSDSTPFILLNLSSFLEVCQIPTPPSYCAPHCSLLLPSFSFPLDSLRLLKFLLHLSIFFFKLLPNSNTKLLFSTSFPPSSSLLPSFFLDSLRLFQLLLRLSTSPSPPPPHFLLHTFRSNVARLSFSVFFFPYFISSIFSLKKSIYIH